MIGRDSCVFIGRYPCVLIGIYSCVLIGPYCLRLTLQHADTCTLAAQQCYAERGRDVTRDVIRQILPSLLRTRDKTMYGRDRNLERYSNGDANSNESMNKYKPLLRKEDSNGDSYINGNDKGNKELNMTRNEDTNGEVHSEETLVKDIHAAYQQILMEETLPTAIQVGP